MNYLYELSVSYIKVFIALILLGSCKEPREDYNYRRILNYDISRYNLEYQKPKGFKEIVRDSTYSAARQHAKSLMWGNSRYEIASLEHDINICYSSEDIVATIKYIANHPNIQKIRPDPNGNYLKLIEDFTDTLKYRLYRYPDEIVSKTWNATEAILCTTNTALFNQNPLFREKYDKCKVLTIHKENVADLFLYYWYNDKSANVIDRVISETKEMIRFK